MNVIPLGDRIIVRLAHPDGQRGSHAKVHDDQPVRGIVIAVGAGRADAEGRTVPLSIAAGETILFGRHLGQEIMIGETPCWVIKAEDVVKDTPGPSKLLRDTPRARPGSTDIP